jgi:hypothetical protein
MRKIFSPYKKVSAKEIFGDIFVGLCTTVMLGFIIVTALDAEMNRVVKYDCNALIGGWHPDVPPKVIEECRKVSKGKYDT